MARIRTIKPDFWSDPKVVTLPFEARLFYIGLWNLADDVGCVADEPLRLRFQIFPADPELDGEHLVELLVEAGFLVRRVTEEGKPFLHIRRFLEHQRINRPSTPAFTSDPEVCREASRSTQ